MNQRKIDSGIRGLTLWMIIVIAVTYCIDANAHDCPALTPDQMAVLNHAHQVGARHGYGTLVAAMAWHESMEGTGIYRIKVDDGVAGSYGVMHVQVTTALWMLDRPVTFHTLEHMAHRLAHDDAFALRMGLRYLLLWESRGLPRMIAKYNGSGARAVAYSKTIMNKTTMLEQCLHAKSQPGI